MKETVIITIAMVVVCWGVFVLLQLGAYGLMPVWILLIATALHFVLKRIARR